MRGVLLMAVIFFRTFERGLKNASSLQGKTGRNLVLTMNVKILESSAVAQLISSFSPWISMFKPQNSICGTYGRQNDTETLVQTMLKFLSLDTYSP
jgi:hypothetical protein